MTLRERWSIRNGPGSRTPCGGIVRHRRISKVAGRFLRPAKQGNPRELALTDFAQTLFGLNEFSYLR